MTKTKPDIGRISRFIGVGIAATLTHGLLLIILVEALSMRPAYATVLAFLAAFIVSYLGHYHFTFKAKRSHKQAMPSYGLIALVGAIINFTIILLMSDVLNYHYMIAFIVTIFAVPPLVYSLSRDHAFDNQYLFFTREKLWSSKLLWAPATMFALITLTYSLAFHYRVPFFDHWDIVGFYESMQNDTLKLSDLFALHGSHWHSSGYLVMLGLSKLTAMNHGYEVLCSVIFAVLGFIALVRILLRSVTLLNSTHLLPWVLGVSAFIFFSLDQAANWLWGWQVAVFLNIAGVLWTIDLLSQDRIDLRRTCLAILAATLAVYGFATAWALLPIGYVLMISSGALLHRMGRLSLLLWTMFTGGLLWHFMLLQNANETSYLASTSPPLTDVKSLIGLTHYSLNFLGSPIVRFARDIAVPITLLGAGLAIWALLSLRHNKHFIKAVIPILALMAYAAGSALLTSYGRWQDFGVKQAFSNRYITFGNFYWIGIFVLCILASGKASMKSSPIRISRILIGICSLLLVLKSGNSIGAAYKRILHAQTMNSAAEQIVTQYSDHNKELYKTFSSPHQNINPRLDILKKNNVSLFRGVKKQTPEDKIEDKITD